MNKVQSIIKEICEELNIDFKLISNNWVIVLEKENKKKYIVGYKFPLNDQTVGKICDDKYATYEIMKMNNIPVIEHFIIFQNYNKDEIIEYCQKYNFDVVVKDNYGTCGNNMYHITNKKDLFKIASNYNNVYVASVCLGANPMHTIRCFMEAEKHNGPSIIIAYSPCNEHGIKGGLSNSLEEQKLSVECGYNI